MKGKPWIIAEEKQLLALRNDGKTIDEIARKMNKTPGAIKIKLARLGFKSIVVTNNFLGVTTSTSGSSTVSKEIIVPNELISIEDALKEEANAMAALKQVGLSKSEVARLKALVHVAGDYQNRLANYINYCTLERKIVEMEEKYENLLKRNPGFQGGNEKLE